MYVYIRTDCYTVGFYDPKGKWYPESDHETKEEAASRVHYLNGGNGDETGTVVNLDRSLIEKEGLLEKVNKHLCALRDALVCTGYTEDEVNHAIAGALPYAIADAAVDWSRQLKRN